MEVTTRIEEEAQDGNPAELPSLSDIGSSDDEIEGISTFNIALAKKDLYEIPGCHLIMLKPSMQKALGLEVGTNVSEEFPWKRVRFELLSSNSLFDYVHDGEAIQENFVRFKPDDRVLIGYAPSLIKEENAITEDDPFVMYSNENSAKAAAAIIKNIETYERFMMNKKLIKRPRPWISGGSEAEVDLDIRPPVSRVIDVEIQGVYPMRQSNVTFSLRTVDDLRDGYAELIPGETTFQNVLKQRIHVGIQSSPATVNVEQQTDPTFPRNAWAQYLYEIKEGEEDELDATSEEEEEKPKPGTTSKTPTPTERREPKPPPEISDAVKQLIKVLEFNQIDVYRNDYPLISAAPVRIFTNPYLKEVFCFANISKSHQRYVSAVDWYPTLTGIVVAAYSFTTKVTQETTRVKQTIDEVQRIILQPNPILMWSFTDSLNYKLEFESPREVTALSFCPYDENVLIGGTINGQIVIWDLQERGKHLEEEEHLTITQAANREAMSEFLSWTIQFDEAKWVFPAAVSALEHAQGGAITDIKWLSRDYYISKGGRIHETFSKKKSKFFATVSIDGSIAYWDLEHDIGNVAKAAARKNLPEALSQNESVYKKLDRLIKPEYVVSYPEPIASIICETANFTYTPQTERESGHQEVQTYPIHVEEGPESKLNNNVIVGTYFGRIEAISFEGTDSGLPVNKETVTAPVYSFARVHDGPVVGLEKNPFYPDIFVSIGRTVMAIWKEDFPFTPIMWRVRPKTLTAVKWSSDRPAVLFLARDDGNFEAWDLLARDDNACLTEVLGGGIITVLSEHRAQVPNKVISIGDYNSSFRMVQLPEGFYKPVPNELELLKNYVTKEVRRKKSIQSWQDKWRVDNADIIEERKRAEAEAQKDLERLRTEAEAERRAQEIPEEKKPEPPSSGAHYDLSDKLDKKWDELNLKRLMVNLMARKKVDPEKLERETALEKERLNYEERKKASIREVMSKVSEDIAAVRARLLPVEKVDMRLSDMIESSVDKVLSIAPDYADVEREANEFLASAPPIPTIPYEDIIERCQERRKLLNKALGMPYDRTHFCETQKEAGGFKDWDHGYSQFLESLEEYKREGRGSTPTARSEDLDVLSQRQTAEL